MAVGTDTGFLALCYHYVRSPEEKERFPRILGNTAGDFTNHIKELTRHYRIISPEEVREFYRSGEKHDSQGKIGLLFTFDDGLSDHYLAAKILQDFGIRAFFFIPTCILSDGMPANPIIVHYCLAKYGIAAFLGFFERAAKKLGIEVSIPRYNRGDDVWKVIAEIKRKIHYSISAADSRRLLLDIYENVFRRDYKNALEIMHLTESQIKEIIAMGHSIGSHTHSHFSVTLANLPDSEIEREIVFPGLLLKKIFGVEIHAMSYPFGELADCFSADRLLNLTQNYDLAFTVEEKINTANTPPLELGRYKPMSTDTAADIREKLFQMSQNK